MYADSGVLYSTGFESKRIICDSRIHSRNQWLNFNKKWYVSGPKLLPDQFFLQFTPFFTFDTTKSLCPNNSTTKEVTFRRYLSLTSGGHERSDCHMKTKVLLPYLKGPQDKLHFDIKIQPYILFV